MAAKFDAAEFVKSQEMTLGRLKGLVKTQLTEVATHLGVNISKCSKKKDILEVVAKHLGLDVGNKDDVAQQQTSTSTVDATQIELAKLEIEKEKLELEKEKEKTKAENLKLENLK